MRSRLDSCEVEPKLTVDLKIEKMDIRELLTYISSNLDEPPFFTVQTPYGTYSTYCTLMIQTWLKGTSRLRSRAKTLEDADEGILDVSEKRHGPSFPNYRRRHLSSASTEHAPGCTSRTSDSPNLSRDMQYSTAPASTASRGVYHVNTSMTS